MNLSFLIGIRAEMCREQPLKDKSFDHFRL